MYKVEGSCHCGNISFVAELSNEASTYNPRACDCQFCISHGALYASDNKGMLTIIIKSEEELSRYRQGSRIADFLICKKCGVLTNVCFEENDCVYCSINVRSSKEFAKFGKGHVTQLNALSDMERIKRWKNIWFSSVKIKYEDT